MMTRMFGQIGVLGLLEAEGSQFNSIRTMSKGSGMSETSVCRILKLATYFTCKIRLVHEVT